MNIKALALLSAFAGLFAAAAPTQSPSEAAVRAWLAKHPAVQARILKAADVNGNGVIGPKERARAKALRLAEWRKRNAKPVVVVKPVTAKPVIVVKPVIAKPVVAPILRAITKPVVVKPIVKPVLVKPVVAKPADRNRDGKVGPLERARARVIRNRKN